MRPTAWVKPPMSSVMNINPPPSIRQAQNTISSGCNAFPPERMITLVLHELAASPGMAHRLPFKATSACIILQTEKIGEKFRYLCPPACGADHSIWELAMDDASKIILGIDIGGTKCAAILGTADGTIVSR